MKIIQIIQKPQRRGAEIFAVQLSEELKKIGHQVLVIALFTGPNPLSSEINFIELKRPQKKRLFDLVGWKKLANEIRRFHPDIIQANAADTLKFSVFSKLIFRWRCPIVYRNANQMGDFISGRLHLKFNQFLINQVQGIASVSKASKDDLETTFSIPNFEHRVISIGIDPDQIDIQRSQSLDLELPEKFLLQVGGLVIEKDPLGTLDLFYSLKERHSQLRLVFLGSGLLENELKRKVEEFGISDKVIFIPNQANIFPILKNAKVLVMPSKIEGMPGVILEAMYCRVPVVAYGVGGIPEVLKSGETGWCISPGDSEAFAQTVQEVLQMEESAKQQILNQAHNLVLSHYSLPQVTHQFEDFYKDLLVRN